MKVLIVSDIHANRVALQAVLAAESTASHLRNSLQSSEWPENWLPHLQTGIRAMSSTMSARKG
jgi:hypothetical protein